MTNKDYAVKERFFFKKKFKRYFESDLELHGREGVRVVRHGHHDAIGKCIEALVIRWRPPRTGARARSARVFVLDIPSATPLRCQ